VFKGAAQMTEETRNYVRRPFPWHTLEEVLQIPEAIQSANGGRPMKRVLLANAVGRKPSSSEFRALLRSSTQYGLTSGSEKSVSVSLTPRGEAIVKPRSMDERVHELRAAAETPELFRRIYTSYDNKKLPTEGGFFVNVLERDFQVPRERAAECIQMLVQNGQFVGIIQELNGDLYVLLDSEVGETPVEEAAGEEGVLEDITKFAPVAPAPVAPPAPTEKYIFIAHGRNHKPLEQLERVLKQFNIPYKVAVEEPQIARPISVKVAQTMRACHSAILIFTGDEEYKTLDDQTIRRPSENVIYELGAAAFLYENRIVVFKEEGLHFPTNFQDIGYISFEKDKLDAKGVDLIRELIALGLIKVQPA
jgi:predicted nucleotide-binding protein